MNRSLSPGLGCSKTSVWKIILSVQVLVESARARSSSSTGSNSVLSAWPRLSPVYWSRMTATLCLILRTFEYILFYILSLFYTNHIYYHRGVYFLLMLPEQPGWWTDQRPQLAALNPWQRPQIALCPRWSTTVSAVRKNAESVSYLKHIDKQQQPYDLDMATDVKWHVKLT